MEQNGNQNLPSVTLCRAGCGFYGNASFDGMCSKCYKDALKRKNNTGRVSPTVCSSSSSSESASTPSAATVNTSPVDNKPNSTSSTTPSVETGTTTVPSTNTQQEKNEAKAEEGAAGGAEAAKPEEGSQSTDSPVKDKSPKKKNRCATCKKKVGLTGFECRCGGLYCSLHRYSDKHDCTFNYKELAQEEIRKNNPVVVSEKVQKI